MDRRTSNLQYGPVTFALIISGLANYTRQKDYMHLLLLLCVVSESIGLFQRRSTMNDSMVNKETHNNINTFQTEKVHQNYLFKLIHTKNKLQG